MCKCMKCVRYITLEWPRGWWPQESGFREVQEPLSQALARSVGCPAPGPAHVAHPLWWLWLVNSHTFPVEILKNTWLFLQKNLTPEQEISHQNKQNERSNGDFTQIITEVVFCCHRRQVSPHPAMPRDLNG